MTHQILKFREYRDDELVNEVSVSTRKVEAFKEKYPYEYGYVAELIEAAMAGRTWLYTSRKYSFHDCNDWYEELGIDDGCADPVIEIEVDLM